MHHRERVQGRCSSRQYTLCAAAPFACCQVLSTPTDALIDRLRLLAGQCAIRVFQEQGALEMWQDMRAAVGSQEADPVLQACVAAAAAAGGTTAAAASTRDGGTVGCHHTPITAWDRQHTQAPYIQQQQQHPGGCGSSSSTQTAAGVSNDAACRSSGSSTDMYQPAVAFVSIMFILMLFDEQRFPVFANINLDTGEVVPQVQRKFQDGSTRGYVSGFCCCGCGMNCLDAWIIGIGMLGAQDLASVQASAFGWCTSGTAALSQQAPRVITACDASHCVCVYARRPRAFGILICLHHSLPTDC